MDTIFNLSNDQQESVLLQMHDLIEVVRAPLLDAVLVTR
jgi:hypothetical protein